MQLLDALPTAVSLFPKKQVLTHANPLSLCILFCCYYCYFCFVAVVGLFLCLPVVLLLLFFMPFFYLVRD